MSVSQYLEPVLPSPVRSSSVAYGRTGTGEASELLMDELEIGIGVDPLSDPTPEDWSAGIALGSFVLHLSRSTLAIHLSASLRSLLPTGWLSTRFDSTRLGLARFDSVRLALVSRFIQIASGLHGRVLPRSGRPT